MRIPVATIIGLLLVLSAVEGAEAGDIAGSYSGRYRCREWNTLDLRIEDGGGGRISAVFAFKAPDGDPIVERTECHDCPFRAARVFVRYTQMGLLALD